MKKTRPIKLTSFIDPTFHITLEKMNEKTNYDFLKKTFTKAQIEKIKKYSNKYFDFLINNSADSEAKKIITEWRKSFERKLLFDIFMEIRFSPLYSYEKDDPDLIDSGIIKAIHKLFFYSNLTLLGLIGSTDNFLIRVKKAGKFVNHLSPYNIELYKEVWLKIEALKKISEKENWMRACILVSRKHPEDLEIFEKKDKLYKRFYGFMTNHNIKSIEDFLNYLSTVG